MLLRQTATYVVMKRNYVDSFIFKLSQNIQLLHFMYQHSCMLHDVSLQNKREVFSMDLL